MQTNRRPALQSVCLSGLFLFVASVALTQTSGWGRFAAGLGAYAVLIGLAWTSGLQWDDMGLSRKRALSGLVLGLRVSMVVAAGLLAALLIAPEVFQDERYRQGVWHAVLFALFVVPLQTVLFEELLFRGVVWGLVRKAKGARVATHVSSALFGLWHIAPSLAVDAAAISVGDIGVNQTMLIAGIVLVTYGAGVLLCELRRRSDSLLAPILVHWTINGLAALAAAFVWAGSR